MTTKTKAQQRPRCSANNEVIMYMHCSMCLESLPNGESPRTWAQLEVGFTPVGLQVWCKRHDVNVVHIDFEGVQHPANMDRKVQ